MSSEHGEISNQTICDSCQVDLQWSDTGYELFCPDCGEVVRNDTIDRGPEWREFDESDRSKRRTGAPTTPLISNNGIWSKIGNPQRDANGNLLSIQKRRQINRLQRQHRWGKTNSEKDRTIEQSLQEIKRVGSALGIPRSVLEIASTIQRRVIDEDIIKGRCIESTVGASVYAAARIEHITRSFSEIGSVSRVSTKRIRRAYLKITRQLDLGIPPVSPTEYLPRHISNIQDTASDSLGSNQLTDHEQEAKQFVEAFFETTTMSGRSPQCVASAAIYAAGVKLNQIIPRKLIATATGVNKKVIGEQYRDILRVGSDIDINRIEQEHNGEVFHPTVITRKLHDVERASYLIKNGDG